MIILNFIKWVVLCTGIYFTGKTGYDWLLRLLNWGYSLGKNWGKK